MQPFHTYMHTYMHKIQAKSNKSSHAAAASHIVRAGLCVRELQQRLQKKARIQM